MWWSSGSFQLKISRSVFLFSFSHFSKVIFQKHSKVTWIPKMLQQRSIISCFSINPISFDFIFCDFYSNEMLLTGRFELPLLMEDRRKCRGLSIFYFFSKKMLFHNFQISFVWNKKEDSNSFQKERKHWFHQFVFFIFLSIFVIHNILSSEK